MQNKKSQEQGSSREYNETLQNLDRVTEDLRGVNFEEPSVEEGDLEAQFDTYYTQLSKAERVVESTDNLDQLSVIKERVTVFRATVISFQKAQQRLGNLKKSLSAAIDKIKEKASDILTLISDKVKKISFSEKLLNLTVELSTLKEGSPRYEKIDRAIEALVDTTDLAQLKSAYELIFKKQGQLNFPPKRDHEKFSQTAESILEKLNLSMSEIEYVVEKKPVVRVRIGNDPIQQFTSDLVSLFQQKHQNRLDPNLKRSNQIGTEVENVLSQQDPSVLASTITILENKLYKAEHQANANEVTVLQDAIKTLHDQLNSANRRLDNRIKVFMSKIQDKNPDEILKIVMRDSILGEFIENISDSKILRELVERVNSKTVEGEGAVGVIEGIKLVLALQYVNLYQNQKNTVENKEALLNAMNDLVETMRDNKIRDGLREYVNGNVHRLIELSQQLSNPRNLNRLSVIESDINDLIDSASPEIFDWTIQLMATNLEHLNDPAQQKEEREILVNAIKYLEELKQNKVAATTTKIERTKPTLGSFLQSIANKLKRTSFTDQVFNLTEALSTSKHRGKLLIQVNKLINKTNDPLKLDDAANHLSAKMADKEYLKAEYPSPEALNQFQISAEQVLEKLRDKAAKYLPFNERLKYFVDKLDSIQNDPSKYRAVRENIDDLIKEASATQLASTETYLKEELDNFYADSNYRILFLNVHAKVSERLSGLTGQQTKSSEAVVSPSAPLPQSKKPPRYVESAEEPARNAAKKDKAEANESSEGKFKSKK